MGRPSRLLGCVWLAFTLAGCAAPEDRGPLERTPLRWQLVERRYRDLPEAGAAGDGRVDPDAAVLAFEPVYPEDLVDAPGQAPARLGVEILELFPDREAGVGQPISATVRVANAAPRSRYRLTVEALDPRVRILGERQKTVKGPETATFRFTSGALGKRGIRLTWRKSTDVRPGRTRGADRAFSPETRRGSDAPSGAAGSGPRPRGDARVGRSTPRGRSPISRRTARFHDARSPLSWG
jgi:hypothetical protein